MIPTVPPPVAWERSRSREGPGPAQPTQPAEPASPAGTIDYAPADEPRTPSAASTVDYRDPEEVPLPVHVPPADDDSDDEDNDDRAAAVQTTPGMASSSTKRASSTEDSPSKKSKKDDDNDAHFMSATELYLIHRHQLRTEYPQLSKDPNYWQQALQRRRAIMSEYLNETMSRKDRWRWHQQKGWLTRIHNIARQSTFSPIGVASVPKEANLQSLPWRTTLVLDTNTSTYYCAANHLWASSERVQGIENATWIGLTVFSPKQLAFQTKKQYDQDFQLIDGEQ
eukprot:5834267-Amphidinium_carterae.3